SKDQSAKEIDAKASNQRFEELNPRQGRGRWKGVINQIEERVFRKNCEGCSAILVGGPQRQSPGMQLVGDKATHQLVLENLIRKHHVVSPYRARDERRRKVDTWLYQYVHRQQNALTGQRRAKQNSLHGYNAGGHEKETIPTMMHHSSAGLGIEHGEFASLWFAREEWKRKPIRYHSGGLAIGIGSCGLGPVPGRGGLQFVGPFSFTASGGASSTSFFSAKSLISFTVSLITSRRSTSPTFNTYIWRIS